MDNNTDKIKLGDNEYSQQDLLKMHERAAMFNEQVENDAKVGEYIRQALQSPDGVKEVREFLNKHYPDQVKQDLEIDEINLDSTATANEKAIAASLNKLTQAMKSGIGNQDSLKRELMSVVDQALGSVRTESSANKAVNQIKAELGIDVTPEDIKAAMVKTGLPDPVSAVKLHKFDDILKARSTKTVKPNMVEGQNGEVDLAGLTLSEKVAFARENPELAQKIMDDNRSKQKRVLEDSQG